jgi:chlorite dismutase
LSQSAASESQSTSAPHAAPAGPAVQRQMVNFAFYKLDPAFRRLDAKVKTDARDEFSRVIDERRDGLMCLTYSTVGLRPDCDFLLWRIGKSTDEFQAQTSAINKTRLGGFLTTPHSLVSMTKRSMYIDKLDPHHTAESRTHIIPGKRKYLFVYPFVKTRDWYLLPQAERQRIMNEHIAVGHKYPRVKINTTYSFGLDDQDFVVAFEADSPAEFLDLVQELRETESSKYTVRDTPMYTCRRAPIEEILDSLA